jgi:hypothetical protein
MKSADLSQLKFQFTDLKGRPLDTDDGLLRVVRSAEG